jgi:hypothetical protein
VFARWFAIYFDHLVVGGYAETRTLLNVAPAAYTVAWSDLRDLANFIPTDTNEADSYVLPNLTTLGSVTTSTPSSSVLGIAVIQQQLFVFTQTEVYTTSYLGLPVVFSFTRSGRMPLVGGLTQRTVTEVPGGVILLTDFNLYLFDGSSFRPIASELGLSLIKSSNTSNVATCYYPRRNEFYIRIKESTGVAVCYILDLDNGLWHTRAVDFLYGYPVTMNAGPQYLYLGCASLGYYTIPESDESALAGGFAFAKDTSTGTAYATPKLTTQLFAPMGLGVVKEINATYLGTFVETGDATYVSTDANAQVTISWFNSDDGRITGSPSTNTDSTWVNTAASDKLPSPRLAFRGLALQLSVSGLVANKPPYRLNITELSATFSVPNDHEAEK